jgi:hypothetical protein
MDNSKRSARTRREKKLFQSSAEDRTGRVIDVRGGQKKSAGILQNLLERRCFKGAGARREPNPHRKTP